MCSADGWRPSSSVLSSPPSPSVSPWPPDPPSRVTDQVATRPLADAVLWAGPPGMTLAAEGPLTAAQFASYSPDPNGVRPPPAADPGPDPPHLSAVLARPGVRHRRHRPGGRLRDPGPSRRLPVRSGGHPGHGLDGCAGPRGPRGRRYGYPIASPVVGTEEVVVLTERNAVATLTYTVAGTTTADHPAAAAARIDGLALRQYRLLGTALPTAATHRAPGCGGRMDPPGDRRGPGRRPLRGPGGCQAWRSRTTFPRETDRSADRAPG